MEQLWDPERLRIVGSIMERYSRHLAEGHKIRLGIEGDPCSVYRHAEEAPSGTVVNIQKSDREGGITRFAVRLDSDDTLLELDNRSVDPTKIWEIHPDFIDEFRGSIDVQQGTEPSDMNDVMISEKIAEEYEEYRGQTNARFQEMTDQISRIENANGDFRSTTASTLRYIAADLLHLANGRPLEFSQHYADRYDMAVDPPRDDFRGGRRSRGGDKDRHVFEEEPTSVVYGNGATVVESDASTTTPP